MNADLGEALGYLGRYSGAASPEMIKPAEPGRSARPEPYRYDDRYWRWRLYMAQRIAEKMDSELMGIKAAYVIGSTNSGSAGPGSDIDLIIHFSGNDEQKQQLQLWLEGWSQALAEMNYLKTGYASDGLLDIHIVTDQDIANKTSFAVKIGSITDPALPLKIKE